MNELKSKGSKHLYDSLLPCVAGSVSCLVLCSLVSVQSRQIISFSKPLNGKKIKKTRIFRAFMSKEGD